ncbi:MAG: cysteine desulfurase [Flavobacteriales bacterium]|nr:cysteine desulfurase [Flavobacteriales bacterium]MCB9449301.1 cysteine desulfurase [Flavobacteriales bacterium]
MAGVNPIYLDYNATTPVAPEVLDAMLPFFTDTFGNAASRTHRWGWVAEKAVEEARTQVATMLNCEPQEIIFTSGATESLNLAIQGVVRAYASKGNHLVVLTTEHAAVLDTCRFLESTGFEITWLPVNRNGQADLQLLEESIRPDTVLVCAMHANNETGVISDISSIARIVHEKGSLLCSDTTQSVGKIPLDVKANGMDLATISAHKIYGPKGIGALYIGRKNPRVTLKPLLHGGGHERGLRSGTLNVPGIIGLGKACQLATDFMQTNGTRLRMMRDRLENELLSLGIVSINGKRADRLPQVSNFAVEGLQADRLIKALPHIGMATGSACTSASPKPSHVLTAMGMNEREARSSVRISLGNPTTEAELEIVIRDLKSTLLKLTNHENPIG